MRLWLLCCGVMFAVAQGYQWLIQQTWWTEVQLSLPWTVMGGLGLAIASNMRGFRRSFTASQSPTSPQVAPTASPTAPEAATQSPQTACQTSATPAKPSISFEISRPVARS